MDWYYLILIQFSVEAIKFSSLDNQVGRDLYWNWVFHHHSSCKLEVLSFSPGPPMRPRCNPSPMSYAGRVCCWFAPCFDGFFRVLTSMLQFHQDREPAGKSAKAQWCDFFNSKCCNLGMKKVLFSLRPQLFLAICVALSLICPASFPPICTCTRFFGYLQFLLLNSAQVSVTRVHYSLKYGVDFRRGLPLCMYGNFTG